MSFIRFIFGIFTSISIFFTSLFAPLSVKTPNGEVNFDFLKYPAEAVKTLEEAGLTEKEFLARANDDGELYDNAQGYSDVNGLIVSPYYTAKIGDTQIPVYSALVFLGSTQEGELHSFSEIYIEKGTEFSFNIELDSEDLWIRNAIVLPEKLGVKASATLGKMEATIDDFGIYTFLFNGAGQDCAYTLFVREKVDEEAEINSLKTEYGEQNVIVVEKGLHYIDYFHSSSDNTIVYLKTGAYIVANHKYDIMSEADEAKYIEENALYSNAIGLTRFPMVNFYNCDNVKLLGNGVLDLSHLDRRERRGVVFNYCNNVEVKGIKIVNCPEWSFITYQCENVEISDVDIFGYRQNSDAFAICNSRNVTVDNCFARSGDDLFDVKALGGPADAASRNVSFTNCIAWGGKARCFGICGEVNKEISDIDFTDCAVIYRDATWDNDRVASLAIVVEQADGWIDDITFENIEIFRDEGRAISCQIYEDNIENFSATNIRFKNISYVAYEKSKVSAHGKESNTMEVSLEDINYGNIELKRDNKLFFDIDDCADVRFE